MLYSNPLPSYCTRTVFEFLSSECHTRLHTLSKCLNPYQAFRLHVSEVRRASPARDHKTSDCFSTFPALALLAAAAAWWHSAIRGAEIRCALSPIGQSDKSAVRRRFTPTSSYTSLLQTSARQTMFSFERAPPFPRVMVCDFGGCGRSGGRRVWPGAVAISNLGGWVLSP